MFEPRRGLLNRRMIERINYYYFSKMNDDLLFFGSFRMHWFIRRGICWNNNVEKDLRVIIVLNQLIGATYPKSYNFPNKITHHNWYIYDMTYGVVKFYYKLTRNENYKNLHMGFRLRVYDSRVNFFFFLLCLYLLFKAIFF